MVFTRCLRIKYTINKLKYIFFFSNYESYCINSDKIVIIMAQSHCLCCYLNFLTKFYFVLYFIHKLKKHICVRIYNAHRHLIALTWLQHFNSFCFHKFESSHPFLSFYFRRCFQMKIMCTAVGHYKTTWVIFGANESRRQVYRSSTSMSYFSLVSRRNRKQLCGVCFK